LSSVVDENNPKAFTLDTVCIFGKAVDARSVSAPIPLKLRKLSTYLVELVLKRIWLGTIDNFVPAW
jgi:hypothetical protein